jgi:hypothetical protein
MRQGVYSQSGGAALQQEIIIYFPAIVIAPQQLLAQDLAEELRQATAPGAFLLSEALHLHETNLLMQHARIHLEHLVAVGVDMDRRLETAQEGYLLMVSALLQDLPQYERNTLTPVIPVVAQRHLVADRRKDQRRVTAPGVFLL